MFHAGLLIWRRTQSLVPLCWMSIVHILIFWSDTAHTAALRPSECAWITVDFKASLLTVAHRATWQRLLPLVSSSCGALSYRCGLVRLAPLSLMARLLASTIHASPALCAPACRCPVCLQTRAQAQFILWRPRRQMFTIVPLLGLKTPRVRGAWQEEGAA